MNADRFWIQRGGETWVGWESASGLRFRALNEKCEIGVINRGGNFKRISTSRWVQSQEGFASYHHVRPSCRLEISLKGVPCEEE
jgi:hypothetical protein